MAAQRAAATTIESSALNAKTDFCTDDAGMALPKGEMRLQGTTDETKRLIAYLDRLEMRGLSQLLERRGWQLHILRWLLPRRS